MRATLPGTERDGVADAAAKSMSDANDDAIDHALTTRFGLASGHPLRDEMEAQLSGRPDSDRMTLLRRLNTRISVLKGLDRIGIDYQLLCECVLALAGGKQE